VKNTYNAAKPKYIVPEYRKAELLLIPIDSLYEKIAVPEEALKAAYEARKAKLGKPEKRTFQQIGFPDMAAAKAAREKLSNPENDFAKIAKEYGFKENETDMGTAARSDISDPKIAGAVFSLKVGDVSEVIEGQLAPVIVRVTEIQPGETVPFDLAKEKLRKDLTAEREKPLKEAARNKLNDLINNIEIERDKRTPYADIAKKFKLKYAVVTADHTGLAPDGKKPDDLPASKELMPSMFKTDAGADASAADLTDGGVAFFNVMEIIPQKQKTLEDVKDLVVKEWRANEVKTRVAAKADEIVKEARAGKSLDELAKPYDAPVMETQPQKRDGIEPGLPASAVKQLFVLEKGGYASAAAPQNGRAIFTLVNILPAEPLTALELQAGKKELAKVLMNDYLGQYMAGLESDYGAKTNPRALTQFLGQ
jgi:peptidyl-prolyl cis-trans isomerase D